MDKNTSIDEKITMGIMASDHDISETVRIWSENSNDKVNIGDWLEWVKRILSHELSIGEGLRAGSIGCGPEPQRRNLTTAFKSGLYLIDNNDPAITWLGDRLRKQQIRAHLIKKNYVDFCDLNEAQRFLNDTLTHPLHLVTFYHSLYYCPFSKWEDLIRNVYETFLYNDRPSAIHCVLMTSQTDDQKTTTHLYNRFVKEFFQHTNDQDLCKFGEMLKDKKPFKKAKIVSWQDRVEFKSEKFSDFMKVVWMVMLHPEYHNYNENQMKKIITYVNDKFWEENNQTLPQLQDHLVIFNNHVKPAIREVKLKIATTTGHRHSGILTDARVARFKLQSLPMLFGFCLFLSHRISAS